MNTPQPVQFGVVGRAGIVYATYAGMIASLFAILGSGALALHMVDAWLDGETAAVPTLLALGVALAGAMFGLLSLAMTALLSRVAKPGQAAQESWQQAMDATPTYHRIEYLVALVIAAGAWSLLQ